jgi:hypothetical protein
VGNELSIDLRLALKKLREDIREANKMIKEGLNKSANLGGGPAQDKSNREAGDHMDKLAVKTRRVNQALADQLSAWKRLQNFRKPVIYGQGFVTPPKPDYSGYGPTMNPTQGPMGPGGGLATASYMGGIPPLLPKGGGVKPPPIPSVVPIAPQDAAIFWRRMITGVMSAGRGGAYSNVIAANQMFGAFSGTATGGRALGAMGLGGGVGGAATATGGILIAVVAATAALKALQLTIRQSIAAAERARVLYAKALTGGLGLQFTSQRTNLASVLGVSENEIYQFGNALAFLNPRLADASRISADNATVLAPLAYELRILKLDIEALGATIGADVVPVLRFMVNLFDELAKSAVDVYKALKPVLSMFVANMAGLPGAGNDPKRAMHEAGILAMLAAGPFAGIISRAVADTQRNIGAPGAFMKQMPVSNFERMGLVAGMGSSGVVDYTRRTAVATETIARHLSSGVARSSQTPFGLDPNVSNP